MQVIPVINDQYKIEDMLSSGTYSKVYRAYDLVNKRNVVIKIFESEKVWREVYARRDKLMSVKSRHMPQIYSVDVIAGHRCIIEECICGESLYTLIDSNRLTYSMFFKLCYDLLDALSVLHNMNLVHGDIKPQNVIVNVAKNNVTGYLIDIDSAIIHQTNKSAFFGTLYYAAPEQVIDNKFVFSTDIYSLGLMAYVILEGGLPYERTKEGIRERINANGLPPFTNVQDDSIKYDLWNLLCFMTEKMAYRRPTITSTRRILEKIEVRHLHKTEMESLIRDKSAVETLKPKTYTERTWSTGVLMGTYMISMHPETFMCTDDTSYFWEQEREADVPLKITSTDVSKDKQRTYQKHLLKEYEQLSRQAVISFWLWVTTFVLGLGLIIYAVVLISQEKYAEALTSVVLEALVFFAQRLFAMREEYYRQQNDSKIKHLEVGDYYEYLMSILETTDDEYRKQKLDMVLESIKKQTER